MPHMTFNVDALGFCEPFSLLELILVLVYVISATIIIFAGAAAVDVAGHFGFYQVHCHYNRSLGVRHTQRTVASPDTVCATVCCAST